MTMKDMNQGQALEGVANADTEDAVGIVQETSNALPETPGDFYTFPDGSAFSKELVDGLVAQIVSRAPQLVRGHEMTLRKICGDTYWLSLTKGQRIDAGICGSRLTKGGYVPLVRTGNRNAANARLYYVK